ncbi:hypothetical protein IKI14_00840 [bacterium]|nr:hypothetical protein [bacterium]
MDVHKIKKVARIHDHLNVFNMCLIFGAQFQSSIVIEISGFSLFQCITGPFWFSIISLNGFSLFFFSLFSQFVFVWVVPTFSLTAMKTASHALNL